MIPNVTNTVSIATAVSVSDQQYTQDGAFGWHHVLTNIKRWIDGARLLLMLLRSVEPSLILWSWKWCIFSKYRLNCVHINIPRKVYDLKQIHREGIARGTYAQYIIILYLHVQCEAMHVHRYAIRMALIVPNSKCKKDLADNVWFIYQCIKLACL
jgi:hypothetical protein